MQNLIVSDVFGRTKALEEIAAALSAPTKIIDPYDSKYMNFEDEAEAYTYFMAEVGLAKYAENLEASIQSFSEDLNLIGFSVGASVIWKLSPQKAITNVSGACCFYGSQIRHDRKLCPRFPIQLIFPASEEHFSVTELINDLSSKENVVITQTTFLHGFMNRHSTNFNPNGYEQFMQSLCEMPFNQVEKTASSHDTKD